MDRDERYRTRNASRLFLGLVIISLGVLALLDNLGILHIQSAWRFWPLFLVAVGLSRLLRPAGCPGRWTGFIVLLLGLWFLATNLGVMPYRVRDFWPVIIVLVGARLAWGGFRQRALDMPSSESTPRLSAFALLGGTEHKSNSPDFRGGDVTAIMGGAKLDLRQAGMKSGEAVIDIFAMWGGVEIIVPRDWTVIVQGTPILAAYEDKTNQAQAGGPRLVIRGILLMAGCEIKN